MRISLIPLVILLIPISVCCRFDQSSQSIILTRLFLDKVDVVGIPYGVVNIKRVDATVMANC
jgi:hypothetical protein